MAENGRSRRALIIAGLKAAALLVFLGVSALLFARYYGYLWDVMSHFGRFKQEVRSWGVWGPLALVGFQVVQIVIFVIPGDVTQAAAGALFGPWLGALYIWVGAVLGSALAFLVSDWLGRPLVKALVKPEAFARLENLLNARKGFVTVFVLFVIPGMPKDTLCYVAGLTPIHFWTFLLVSSLARIPGILLSTFLGDVLSSLLGRDVHGKPWVQAVALCLIGLILLTLGLLFRKRIEAWLSRDGKQGENG